MYPIPRGSAGRELNSWLTPCVVDQQQWKGQGDRAAGPRANPWAREGRDTHPGTDPLRWDNLDAVHGSVQGTWGRTGWLSGRAHLPPPACVAGELPAGTAPLSIGLCPLQKGSWRW